MQDYLRPMVGFVALKFSILIAKRLFNKTSVSFNLAFMPVANKVGQKVKKFISKQLLFGPHFDKCQSMYDFLSGFHCQFIQGH